MTYDELMNTIRNSCSDDWLYDDEKGRFTLRSDLDIQIHQQRHEGPDKPYKAEWTEQHPDPDAFRILYDIYYRASFVKTFMLVMVDGCRAYLPYPEPGTKEVPYDRYQIAKVIDRMGTLDEYVQRSGLTIRQS